MSQPLDMNALDVAIKMAVFNSIEQILMPLIDQWQKDIRLGGEKRIGLIHAMNDVQAIIDRGNERKAALQQ